MSEVNRRAEAKLLKRGNLECSHSTALPHARTAADKPTRTSLPDTYSAITNLDSRFGVATEQSLIHTYQTNWITTDDLNNIANAGYNCVRMPVWWGNFYSITNPTSSGWCPDAFDLLDWLVTNCASRGIYVIIDMHGVVGGQSTSDSTGWQNQNQYWISNTARSQTAFIWRQIAAYYNGNPAWQATI